MEATLKIDAVKPASTQWCHLSASHKAQAIGLITVEFPNAIHNLSKQRLKQCGNL